MSGMWEHGGKGGGGDGEKEKLGKGDKGLNQAVETGMRDSL